jgi:hypothetical protein
MPHLAPVDPVEEQRRHFLAALLANPEHNELYHASAVFHHNIEMLITMLPMWIKGMAAAASTTEAKMREEMRRMMLDPNRPWTVTKKDA